MAGTGSRLRGSADTIAKPLIPIGGRPLISYALESFEKAGVERIHAAVGPNGDELAAAVAPLLPPRMQFHPISNPNWQKQNGVSLLTAAGKVRAPFFLAMGDHLFEASILDRLLSESDPTRLNLAIDRKINSIFDLDDAMKVRIDGNRLVAIGKNLADSTPSIRAFSCPNNSTLSAGFCGTMIAPYDGVRLMAEEGTLAIDIGSLVAGRRHPDMLREPNRGQPSFSCRPVGDAEATRSHASHSEAATKLTLSTRDETHRRDQ